MPLQKQNIEITFSKGVDTGTDPKLVIPSKFTRLDDLEFDRLSTARQRPGFTTQTLTAHTGSASVANIRALHVLGEQVLLEARSGLHQFLQDHTISLNGATATPTEKTFERARVDYADLDIPNATSFDAAAANPSGYECWAWETPNGSSSNPAVFYKIVDRRTNSTVQSGTVDAPGGAGASATNPRVVVRDDGGASTFSIFYTVVIGGVASIRVRTLLALAGAMPGVLSASTTLTNVYNDAGEAQSFDAIYSSAADVFFLAFVNTPGTFAELMVLSDDSVTSIGSVVGGVALPDNMSVEAVSSGGTHYGLAVYTSGASLYAISCTSAAASGAGTVLHSGGLVSAARGRHVSVIASPFETGKAMVFYDDNPYTTATEPFGVDICYLKCDATGANPTADSTFARGISLAARPVVYDAVGDGNADVCVFGNLSSDVQNTVFALKFGGAINVGGIGSPPSWASPRVVGRLLSGETFTLEGGYSNFAETRLPTPLAVI
jgi:hypothetical protein